jgi:FMN-dependent NADH-azoreductase
MTKLLQINSSVFAQGGQSTQLADLFVESWKKSHPGTQVTLRDLAANPVPHLDGARVGALFTPPEQRSPEQKAVVAYSDALIAELLAAEIIVLAAPMYNFSIPSVLKAYFDHIARAGVTFRYSETGPVGLISGKKVVVFSTRGGYYANTPKDVETTLIRQFLEFLGITDISFVYAEGLAIGEAQKAAALDQARKEIAALAA